MKKITLSLMALLMTVAMFAANFGAGQRFVLRAGTEWDKDGARFAICCMTSDKSSQTWFSMTAVAGGTSEYEVTIPANETNTFGYVIFCRMNGEVAVNSWDNRWDQTSDLTFDGSSNIYNVPGDQDAWDPSKLNDTRWSAPAEITADATVPGTAFVGDNVGITVTASDASATVTFTAEYQAPGATTFTSVSGTTFAVSATGDYQVKITPTVNGEAKAVIEKTVHVVNAIDGGKTLYLSAAQWTGVNVRFAAYFYDNAGNTQWTSMEAVTSEENTYSLVVPTGRWTNVIFCQMKGDQPANDWQNKNLQTEDIEYDGVSNLFTIAVKAEGAEKYNGEWSIFSAPTTDLDQTTADVEVYSHNSTIYSNEKIVRIYTITGQDVTAENGRLAYGVYIVRTATSAQKVIVK